MVPWSVVWVGVAVAAGVVSFLAAVADDLQRQEHNLEALAMRKRIEASQPTDFEMEGAELVTEGRET